ncbi:MAG TPA: 2-oxoacid:ferredoxin oxidoreductase subunit beta, partial [Marinilabiliaceae bacterium]|nr:2-oxoacid:ferredoxin oxidoreductase subunit beta [Marinilabiliaceae bacterium]
MEVKQEYTFSDFKSELSVRWCPGCGDHAILNTVQKSMAELGLKPHEVAVISGIGCSSRFTYYMNTFGFHTIHGRASAIATGVKIANPQLKVWQITGDGDALAIGGNHFIHAIRRNVNLNMILFNNQIYGLTKGQYSPTSKHGFVSKSSPFGTVEHPFRPGELTIGARGNFFARTIDKDLKLCVDVFKKAAQHEGASVVEVLQNCVIYNDKTHEAITDKEHREDRTILLEHGEPMIFGKNRDKGLILDGMTLKIVT